MLHLLVFTSMMAPGVTPSFAQHGATVPWVTYEAEDMTNTGTVMGPKYEPNVVEAESSGRRCVKLSATGQYMQFAAKAAANSMVVRYSVPDTANGVGADYTLSLYINQAFAGKLPLTSRYSWLYGKFPFNNDPSTGSPRNFYDEVRTNGLSINPGDLVRLQKDGADTATSYVVDLVELENVSAPLKQPANSVSIKTYGAGGRGITDDTTPLNDCIKAALSNGKSVWLPPGTYKITGNISLPSDITIQGAGMWYATLAGDPELYTNPSRRVFMSGNGSNIHLADFAIIGKVNYRKDTESNDGLVGSYGTGSAISRIWVEHTRTGAWLVNSCGLVVDSCRFRDTIADGINLCVGMRSAIVTNCTARGTGDDCFSVWPESHIPEKFSPGLNVITHCTAQTPFLANGSTVYGGFNNRIEDCLFRDMPYGCGILISSTFHVGANVFSGTTVARRCDLIRCGGYDPGYKWRAALQICMDTNAHGSAGISGVDLNNLNITDSISEGMSIVGNIGTLTNAVMSNVNIHNYGVGVSDRHGLWIKSGAKGSLTVSNSAIGDTLNNSDAFNLRLVNSAPLVDVRHVPRPDEKTNP